VGLKTSQAQKDIIEIFVFGSRLSQHIPVLFAELPLQCRMFARLFIPNKNLTEKSVFFISAPLLRTGPRETYPRNNKNILTNDK